MDTQAKSMFGWWRCTFGKSNIFDHFLNSFGRVARQSVHCQSNDKVEHHSKGTNALGRNAKHPIFGNAGRGIKKFKVDDVAGRKRDPCQHAGYGTVAIHPLEEDA